MFLKKLRTRRSENTGDVSTTPRKSKSGVFNRRKAVAKDVEEYEPPPDLMPGLTMTLSQETDDEEQSVPTMTVSREMDDDVSLLSLAESLMSNSGAPYESGETTFTFTEKQVMENSLQHMREISAKEREVFKIKTLLEELKSIHWAELQEKAQELAACKSSFEALLNTTEGELCVVRTALSETKQELKQVSSVLIECQHKLHETKSHIWGTWKK